MQISVCFVHTVPVIGTRHGMTKELQNMSCHLLEVVNHKRYEDTLFLFMSGRRLLSLRAPTLFGSRQTDDYQELSIPTFRRAPDVTE